MFHCSTKFIEFIKICSPLNLYMKKRIRKEKRFFFLYNLIFSGTSGTYCCNPCCYRFLVFHFYPKKSGTCSTKSGTFNGFLPFQPFFQCLLSFPKKLYICINIDLEANEKPTKRTKMAVFHFKSGTFRVKSGTKKDFESQIALTTVSNNCSNRL